VATATVVNATVGPVFDIVVKQTKGDKKSDAVHALVRETFERASAAGKAERRKKTVVLFIHGFAKPYASAVMDGYALRARFPDCEPLLFSWPSGRTGGILQAVFGYNGVSNAAVKANLGLSGALVSLGVNAKHYATKVNEDEKVSCIILARSMGTLALANAIGNVNQPDYNGHLTHIKRVVLSSPALQNNKQLMSFKWLSGLTCQKVITVNQNDQTLRFANWLDGTGTPMGIAPPAAVNDASTLYFDFTASGGVGRLHDYLFPRVNPRVVQVNDALMSADALMLNTLHELGAVREIAPQVFHVN
jgi:esterase/lipase superfamily enzyme